MDTICTMIMLPVSSCPAGQCIIFSIKPTINNTMLAKNKAMGYLGLKNMKGFILPPCACF